VLVRYTGETWCTDVILPQSIAVPVSLILCWGIGTSVSAQEVDSLKSFPMHTHAHGQTLPREVPPSWRTVLRVRQLPTHEDGFGFFIFIFIFVLFSFFISLYSTFLFMLPIGTASEAFHRGLYSIALVFPRFF
jgi:hypothetical protein